LNAALAISALTNSSRFDLRHTYFLISGVAGVNPKWGTLGSVTFPRFAVQVDLQYEVDGREIPDDWSTGYVPQGASSPGEFPKSLYGTEVYELNDDLRQRVLNLVKDVTLADSDTAVKYRSRFVAVNDNVFEKATMPPSVIDGDVASSNVYFHGHLLSEAFEKVFKLLTGGRGSYSMTNQEDNGTLEALLRAALQNRIDFARVIIMRSGSNFDRSVDESGRPTITLPTKHVGLEPALENLYWVGAVIVREILHDWKATFGHGIKATNYVGGIFGSLGGTPDFGADVGST
jgi:purine nucleoside permease